MYAITSYSMVHILIQKFSVHTADADAIKAILTRLTNHATFPNVFIAEKSLGGSDDLERLHESGELTKLLTAAGVDIKGGFADD